MAKAITPNRGLAKACKQVAGAIQPRIDPNRCEGKGPCVAVCPVFVFELGILPKTERHGLSIAGRVKGMVHGWKQARLVQPQDCQGCGLCVQACPEQAISLERRAMPPVDPSTASIRQVAQGADL